MAGAHEVTMLLSRLAAGDKSAAEPLMPLVYGELRALAGAIFKAESPGHTLQPTALVHEAFIRLVGGAGSAGASRAHFMAVAAKVMRNLLIDHARAARTAKRGGGAERRSLMTLDQTPSAESMREADVLDLDEAIRALAAQYPRAAEVVELRYFGGLTNAEIANWLGISDATAERDWALARGWLARRLTSPGASG